MFKTLILMVTIYLVARLLRNIFSPARPMAGAQQQPNMQNPYSGARREGDIKIVDIQARREEQHRHKSDDNAEYIDYKEI